jgi:hypothetical protein
MRRASAELPACAGWGEPIGVYEPLWRVDPRIGAQPTSWLRLLERTGTGIESLWHATCAEAEAIEGG